MKVERASVGFVRQWVYANILGWISGAIVGQFILHLVISPIIRVMGLPLDDGIEGPVGLGAIMTGVGAMVGIMQWRVLRRKFSCSSWWVLANTIGWAMGGCLGGIAGWNTAPFVVPSVFGAAAGFGAGVIQWLILRRHFSRAGWWVLASTAAWGGCMSLGSGTQNAIGSIMLIVGVILAGVITGIALFWLLNPQKIQFRQKLGYAVLLSVPLILGPVLLVNAHLHEKKEINALIERLRDEDADTRGLAAEHLERKFGRRAQNAVPALIELLNDDHGNARQSAASALGSIGKPAKAAIPALMDLLSNENELVRVEVAGALGRIDNSNLDMVLHLLTVALENGSEGIRGNAANALGDIGRRAREAVPALTAALGDESESVRNNTVNALREIGTSEARKAMKEYRRKGVPSVTPQSE